MLKPKKKSIRCSSGPFKDHSIIRQIVGRVHVGDPVSEVVAYAKSRLAAGAWDTMSKADRRAFECEVKKQHARNLDLYTSVMRGMGARRRRAR
jgi:hypothetical protein